MLTISYHRGTSEHDLWRLMKRVTITLDDDIEVALESYISSQEAKPSLTAVIQAATREFLIGRNYLRRTPLRQPKGRGRASRVATGITDRTSS